MIFFFLSGPFKKWPNSAQLPARWKSWNSFNPSNLQRRAFIDVHCWCWPTSGFNCFSSLLRHGCGAYMYIEYNYNIYIYIHNIMILYCCSGMEIFIIAFTDWPTPRTPVEGNRPWDKNQPDFMWISVTKVGTWMRDDARPTGSNWLVHVFATQP